MAKTSDNLKHLARAAFNAHDIADNKSEASKRHEERVYRTHKATRNKHAIAVGIDPKVVEEIDPGVLNDEEPDRFAQMQSDMNFDSNQTPKTKMRKAELKGLYVTSTLAPDDFWNKYLREGESKAVWERIARNDKWDDQRISYYEDRIDNVVEHYKQDMEDQLHEHNQMHLQISKQIGLKIMQILPNVVKAVELQSCAVALKNIQSVSRLALGASTDNTALKGVDDFEAFLTDVATSKKVGGQSG